MISLKRNFIPLCCAFVCISCTNSCHSQSKVTAPGTKNDLQNKSNEAVKSNLKRIVFLGDSITAGYGLDPSQSYPSLIRNKMTDAGLNWEVVNAGISGDTTSGALSRLDWVFQDKVDVIFICLGANDGFRGVPVDEIKSNLEKIIAKSQSEGAKVLLAGIKLPKNYGNSYVKEFENIFPILAKEFDIQFLPYILKDVGGVDKLNQKDRIHPTAQGAKIVSETVWKFLEPQLKLK